MLGLLGLLGLRIFEAWGATIDNLGEEHGYRVLKIRGKRDKTVLIPLPPAVARAVDRTVDGRDHGPILRNAHGVRMDRHAASRRLKVLADEAGIRIVRMHPHMLRQYLRHDHARRRRQPPRRADHRPPRRPPNHHALRPRRKNLDRHPNYILAAYMASGT
jgi:site-specific recombinase XerD